MRNYNGSLPSQLVEHLNAQAELATKATSIDSVRGHEGQATALYFNIFAGMFKTELAAEFDVNG